ncbi:bifunctional cobalt-precorrin-7 (C(5))-methyltransferase/cobalt-precorrin-6B (C(15))-methyltransferase [Desulfurivibrio alkaliphilus]|uniref:Precorrin-6y C5,15-methyltransferase (Decarboxylating), CbiE subunit n=1 Tax=Desulfurivibrio alkaliphilus (strain DSM 19089 / UNIQEM U267 / AHT2) TaxID=589865 RepID=D6Z404_DESAT|nr:bifunctional cobalt-precorrin-7 (C(5))-methyltransferase/cobalt-precorrin-6B (C(15))-methyltransferase [Desulfurivibrio alkaliphilus]ADH86279.1 precorrin-6y C5,15-methyltransferase (decarboxylating), CbiE subunit [Desulfurivibrio alkaliphilus AHT 2]
MTTTSIIVIGVGDQGLSDRQLRALAGCRCLVAGERHRPLVAGLQIPVVPVTPLKGALTAIKEHLPQGKVGVLASGDPLFFGIGRTLLHHFAPEQLEFMPALSTVQQACARFRLPWDDARVISLHGREAGETDLLLNTGALLAAPKTIIFTDGRRSPDLIATRLRDYLALVGADRLLAATRVLVAENLGGAGERLITGSLGEIAGQRFAPLNIMVLQRAAESAGGGRISADLPAALGLQTEEIRHSRGLITKDEVRAVTLHKLRLPATGVCWDIGAGSGSVSLEASRLAPGLAIYAVERRAEELANIKANIVKLAAYTIRPVAGEAPAALAALPDPDRIFIGGSGGRLAEILAAALPRLRPGGRVVINGVTAATKEEAPRLLRRHGCPVEVTEVSISRRWETDAITADDTAGAGTATRLNPINIICGHKQ